MKLRSLSLEHFRGATQPVTVPFDEGKNFTMIFGENGTGKSTIVDAFSFICEQSAGSLLERSSTDNSFLISITANGKTPSLALLTDAGEWKAGCNAKGSGIKIAPAAGIPAVRVLRRSQILKLVDQIPAKRYEALEEYIAIPKASKCEDTLKKATRAAGEELNRAVQTQQTAEKNLNTLWEAEGKPDSDAESWAKKEAAHDVTLLETHKSEAAALGQKLDDLDRARTTWNTRLESEKQSSEALATAEAALKAEEAVSKGQERSLVGLLKQAQQFVSGKADLSACPVCEQGVDRAELSAALGTRISSMEKLGLLAQAFKDAEEAHKNAKKLSAEGTETYVRHLRLCAAALTASTLDVVKTSTLAFTELKVVAVATTSAGDCIKAEAVILNAIPAFRLLLTAAQENWDKAIKQHGAIVTYYNQLVESRAKTLQAKDLSDRAKQAAEIVETVRKDFIQSELQSIAGEVDRLYEAIHPGEKLGSVKLELDPQFQQSLNLTANFHSKTGITPQSLYSESHLDTLGFAVFFALAKKYQTTGSVVVLDDVVTSVDEVHLDRFIQLLHDESKNFAHVLVTTHYRPWRDRYKNQRAPGGKVHFIELRPWSLERGLRVFFTKGLIDELKAALEAFNRQQIASVAGILMENILDWMTMRYGCRMPRKKDPQYTLGDLLSAVSNKDLINLLKVERVLNVAGVADATGQWTETPLKDKIAAIKGLSAVRNQVGCHYNFDGSLVSDKDVEAFGQAALELAELVCCPVDGDLPSSDKSAQYLETRSKLVRLYPIKIPGTAGV